MVRVTLDCVMPKQSSLIQIIHCNVSLKFFSILSKCLFVIIVMHISLIVHKVVQRRIYVVVGYVIISLLQTVCRVCR